jgi:hypothetical protein
MTVHYNGNSFIEIQPIAISYKVFETLQYQTLGKNFSIPHKKRPSGISKKPFNLISYKNYSIRIWKSRNPDRLSNLPDR